MRQRVLGTLTIGQAPRPDVVPIIDRHVSADIRRIHRGVLDGLSHAEIAARVSTRRETVAREFKALERAGLIERRRGAIALIDAHHLRRQIEEAVNNG